MPVKVLVVSVIDSNKLTVKSSTVCLTGHVVQHEHSRGLMFVSYATEEW